MRPASIHVLYDKSTLNEVVACDALKTRKLNSTPTSLISLKSMYFHKRRVLDSHFVQRFLL